MTLRWLAFYFGLGASTDVLVVLYYKSIQGGAILPAVILSALITAIPFLVTERAITARSRIMFLAYALGAGVGTAIGMLVHIT